MHDLGVQCNTCIFFDDEGEENNNFYCNYYPEPVLTIPNRYCNFFRCLCGGDIEDGIDHTDCLEISFESE
jgi:hypothetical protein